MTDDKELCFQCGDPLCAWEKFTERKTINTPLLTNVTFDAVYTRHPCVDGIFVHNEYDVNLGAAMEKAIKPEYEATLKEYMKRGESPYTADRLLGLPIGTIQRWVGKGATKESLIVLKLITALPWLLEVTSGKYGKEVCEVETVRASMKILEEKEKNEL